MLASCTALSNNTQKEPEKKDYFLARITFYTDDPRWGKKTSSGEIAEQGTTVAAARGIPYGTEYYIPRLKEWMNTDGNFEVHDRGSAVDRRTASRGKLPVIDIYVSSPRMVEKLGQRSNNVFKVYRR